VYQTALLFQSLDAMIQFHDLLGEPEFQLREPLPHFGAQASYLGAYGFNLRAEHARVDPGRKHDHDQAAKRARIAGIHTWSCGFMD